MALPASKESSEVSRLTSEEEDVTEEDGGHHDDDGIKEGLAEDEEQGKDDPDTKKCPKCGGKAFKKGKEAKGWGLGKGRPPWVCQSCGWEKKDSAS
jgi:rubredoxin